MFQVNITKNRASTTAAELLTYGQVGAQVQFTFSDDWAGLKKTAVFKRCGKTIDVLESQWDNNIVTIPPEMTQLIGAMVRVGVYGRNDSGKRVTPTVYTNLSIVAAAADPSGDESTGPSLPVWGQLQSDLDKAVQIVPQNFTDEEMEQARENIQAVTKKYVDAGDIQADWNENDPASKAYIKNRIGGYDQLLFDAYHITTDEASIVYISSLNRDDPSAIDSALWTIATAIEPINFGTIACPKDWIGKTVRVLEGDTEILSITPTTKHDEFLLHNKRLEAGHQYAIEVDGIKQSVSILIPNSLVEPRKNTIVPLLVQAFADEGSFVSATMTDDNTKLVFEALRAKQLVEISLINIRAVLYPASDGLYNGSYWFASTPDEATGTFFVAKLSTAGTWTCTHQSVATEQEFQTLVARASELEARLNDQAAIPKFLANPGLYGIGAPTQHRKNEDIAWTRVLPVVYYNAINTAFEDIYGKKLSVDDLYKYNQFVVYNLSPGGTPDMGVIALGLGRVTTTDKRRIQVYGFREVGVMPASAVLTPTYLMTTNDLTADTVNGYRWAYNIPRFTQLSSPDGSVFNIAIDDSGNLTTAKA